MVMVEGDLVGIQVLRQAGRQAAPRQGSAGALLFLLLLLLFLDPRNSEQAAAGAAPLLRREGGRQKRLGDVNTSGRDVLH